MAILERCRGRKGLHFSRLWPEGIGCNAVTEAKRSSPTLRWDASLESITPYSTAILLHFNQFVWCLRSVYNFECGQSNLYFNNKANKFCCTNSKTHARVILHFNDTQVAQETGHL